MPTQKSTDIIRNLLIIISEIDEQNRREKAFLSETWFHKLLFNLQRRIDNIEVKTALQFYWYIHGPYSEDVRRELQALEREGIFEVNPTLNGNAYRLNTKPKIAESKSLAQAGRVMLQIYKENNLYDLKSTLKTIYIGAPYEFMSHYKFNYLESLKDLKSFIESNEEKKFIDQYKSKVIDYLYDAETLLPTSKLFETYNQVFSNMVGEITSVLSLLSNYNEEIYSVESAIKLSEEAWECFAKGIRIEEHDSAYDSRIEVWEKTFQDSLKGYASNLALFSQQQLKRLDGKNLRLKEELPPSIGIMRAIVLGYLNE